MSGQTYSVESIAHQAATDAATAAKALAVHEAVCAERYDQIKMRLGRLEGGLVGGGGAIILLLLSIMASVLLKG